MSPARRKIPTQKRLLVAGLVILVVLVLIAGAVTFQRIIADPNITLLLSEHGADWIRFRERIQAEDRKAQAVVSIFRTRFKVNNVPGSAILSFRAMKRATVWLDNRLLYKSEKPLNEWKKLYHVDLAPSINRGTHELRIEVLNQNGHPALLAYCKPLKIFTGEQWEGSKDGKSWTQALPVHDKQTLPLSRKFQRADRALLAHLPFFIPIFIIVFVSTILCTRQDRPYWLTRIMPTAKRVRWIILVLWVILAINNIGKVPIYIGMDLGAHMDYIRYVAEKLRIPLPTEGWQMFQSPLFYMLSAIIYKFCLNLFSLETIYRILRILPLLCGVAQVELCYRALRYVYPKREDLQALGTVIGGLLPMNLYFSQVVGNEPLAGCLTGIVVVLAFRLFSSSSRSKKVFPLMGLFLGLALLTKVTAILIIPPLLFFISYRLFTDTHPSERPVVLMAQRIGLVLVIAVLISGWYYVRNWVQMGQIYTGGWDPSRGMPWWQDPGYRTVEQFLTFGEALFYPIYSTFAGVCDSLYSTMWVDGFLSGQFFSYRPPWNYGFMLSSAWLSLVPCGAILLGILVAVRKSSWALRQGVLFAAVSVIVYLSTILYLFLILPVYSTGKATYTLGLIPCFAVLGARGIEILTRRLVLRATIFGMVACWAFSVYFAFFVFHNPGFSPEEHNLVGEDLFVQGKIDQAISHYSEALRIQPDNVDTLGRMANALAAQGKIDEAVRYYSEVLRMNPNYAEAHINLGAILTKQGRMAEAISHYSEALRIDPGYIEAHNNMGNVFAAQGKLDEAISHFSEVLRVNPKYAEVHNNLGAVLIRKGKINEAIDHFQEALRINPVLTSASDNLKTALAVLSKLDETIAKIQEGLNRNPQDYTLHYKLGILYQRKGELDKAKAHYQKAVSIQPDFAKALNKLATVLVAKSEYNKAISLYRHIIRLRPNGSGAYYNIACIYARQNRIEESIEWLKKAIGKGYVNWDLIKTDKDLENIRASSHYKKLIKGH